MLFVEHVSQRKFSFWLIDLKINGKDPLQPRNSQFSILDTTFANIHVRTGGEVTCSKKAGKYASGNITIIRVAEAGRHLVEEPEETHPSTKGTWVFWAWVNYLLGIIRYKILVQIVGFWAQE